jgi:hypothetical protein
MPTSAAGLAVTAEELAPALGLPKKRSLVRLQVSPVLSAAKRSWSGEVWFATTRVPVASQCNPSIYFLIYSTYLACWVREARGG